MKLRNMLKKKKKSGTTALCQCASFFCLKRIKLSQKEVEEFFAVPEAILISNKCRRGAETTDKLIEKREKYSIYIDEDAEETPEEIRFLLNIRKPQRVH